MRNYFRVREFRNDIVTAIMRKVLKACLYGYLVVVILALALQVGVRPGLSMALTFTPGSEDQTFTVQQGVSDLDMFGRNLDRTYSAPASTANLKPGSGPIVPYRVRIPALGIDAHIESVGL